MAWSPSFLGQFELLLSPGGRMLRCLLSARLKPTWVENGRWRAKQKVSFSLRWEGSPLSQCQGHRMPLLTRLLSADGIYRPRCPAREHLNIGERNSDWGLCAHPLTGQVTLGESSQLPKPLLCQLYNEIMILCSLFSLGLERIHIQGKYLLTDKDKELNFCHYPFFYSER